MTFIHRRSAGRKGYSSADADSATQISDDPSKFVVTSLHAVPGQQGTLQSHAQDVSTIIVGKSALYGHGLAASLVRSHFRVTASISSLSELPGNVSDGPCVLLLDIKIIAGKEAQITALTDRGFHVILLTNDFRRDEMLAALDAGASAYLARDALSPEVLVRTLDLVLLGGVYILDGDGQTRTGLSSLRHETDFTYGHLEAISDVKWEAGFLRSACIAPPTRREQVVLHLLKEGASNKEIAKKLGISGRTVKVHVTNLLRKLGVANRTQAATWAMQNLREVTNE